MNGLHTPSPWFADIGETAVIRDATGNQIAIFTHLKTKSGGRRDASQVARNTQVAAAAPDLLEAAINVLSHKRGEDDWLAVHCAKFESAIAKATKVAL